LLERASLLPFCQLAAGQLKALSPIKAPGMTKPRSRDATSTIYDRREYATAVDIDQ
jgi:hypothetical protein